MRASIKSNKRRFQRIIAATTTCIGLLVCGFSNAGIIYADASLFMHDLVVAKPLQALQTLKIDTNKSAFVAQEAYFGFAQDHIADTTDATLWFCHSSTRIGMNCVAAPSKLSVLNNLAKDEKSITYVQARHFKYYVMPNSRENPSEIDRMTFNHQASGTQSRMLVMTK
jgi:hypothetical protein